LVTAVSVLWNRRYADCQPSRQHPQRKIKQGASNA